MLRVLLYLFITIYLSSLTSAGAESDYIWPLKLKPDLTSRFCDHRAGHFHAGLDIRTKGKPGYRVYAIDDGYIFRVTISFKGYGKALYLKLKDGRIAVYGHLSSLGKALDERIRKKQMKEKHYRQNLFFKPGDIPIKKGQVLGLSGSSGVGAPHLHLEIRSENNNPINPLIFGYGNNDTEPPVFERLAVRHYKSGFGLGDPCDLEFPEIIKGKRVGEYSIQDTIIADGDIALAVAGGDRIPGKGFIYGYYNLRLYVEDSLIFEMNSDSISYETTGQIDYIRDLELSRIIGEKNDEDESIFYRLYVPPGERQFFWDRFKPNSGIILPEIKPDRLRRILIVATDEAGNESSLRFYLMVPVLRSPDPEFLSYYRFGDTVEVDFLTFKAISDIRVQCRGREIDPFKGISSTFATKTWRKGDDIAYLNTLKIISPYIGKEYRFRFAVNSNQVSEWIHFYDRAESSGLKVYGSPKHLRLEYFPDSVYSSLSINIQNKDLAFARDMDQRGLRAYSTDILGMGLSGPTGIIIKNGESVLVDTQIVLYPAYPDGNLDAFSIDSTLAVSLDTGSSYYPVYIFPSMGTKVHIFAVNAIVFNIEPAHLTADLPLSFRFDLKRLGIAEKKIGAYGYWPEKNKWGFLGGSDGSAIEVAGLGLGRLALIEDNDPPEIESIIPKGRTRTRTPLLSCVISDKISGVAADSSLTMTIDDIWVPAEYDIDIKKFSYQVRNNLKIGRHKLEIRAFDKQGNSRTARSQFTIPRG